MKNKNCELCNGTGWYGDNGPGIRGNREYVPCEHCNPKADGDYAVLGDGWRDAMKETPDEAIELMNNFDLMQTQFKELKKSMIKYIRKEIRGVSTYQLQKNGIDSKSYKTLNTNPESMSIDTLIKINKKVIKMKTGI